MAHFDPPMIQDNENGWGPCNVPDKYKDMPYQPFAKGDRLGKVINLPPASSSIMSISDIHPPSRASIHLICLQR